MYDTNHDRLPPDLLAEHDKIMAMAPIAYRGYTIKPTSHRFQPFYDRGRFTYWGWNVIDSNGANAGPGAVWSRSIGGAKTIIDCLCEAGPAPVLSLGPPSSVSRKAYNVSLEALRAWNERFWSLMRERDSD